MLSQPIETFLDSLLAGDHAALAEEANRLADNGMTPYEIAISLIDPLLVETGRRWAESRLTVAHEHLITALCERTVVDLGRFIAQPLSVAPVAVIGCGPGERHALGARIVANTLQAAGWRTVYLGADTPTNAFLTVVSEWEPALVCLSVATSPRVQASADLARRLTSAHPNVRLVVGGRAADPRDFPTAELVIGRDLAAFTRVLADPTSPIVPTSL